MSSSLGGTRERLLRHWGYQELRKPEDCGQRPWTLENKETWALVMGWSSLSMEVGGPLAEQGAGVCADQPLPSRLPAHREKEPFLKGDLRGTPPRWSLPAWLPLPPYLGLTVGFVLSGSILWKDGFWQLIHNSKTWPFSWASSEKYLIAPGWVTHLIVGQSLWLQNGCQDWSQLSGSFLPLFRPRPFSSSSCSVTCFLLDTHCY